MVGGRRGLLLVGGRAATTQRPVARRAGAPRPAPAHHSTPGVCVYLANQVRGIGARAQYSCPHITYIGSAARKTCRWGLFHADNTLFSTDGLRTVAPVLTSLKCARALLLGTPRRPCR